MSITLTLLPFSRNRMEDSWSPDVLMVESNRDFLEYIQRVAMEWGHRVPDDFDSHLGNVDVGDEASGRQGFGPTTRDAYNNPIYWLPAKCFSRWRNMPEVLDVVHNRAVWAFLGQLPPEWPVALYWS